MPRRDHEQLDIYEMERLVARAVVDLIDDPRAPAITFKGLVARTELPKHRVREVIDEWQLRTVSGDEYLLTPELVEHIRRLASVG
ncbi:MAG: hypothetical protein QM778_12450 [Myxococcales bacterium]